jgi:hypothetical protein
MHGFEDVTLGWQGQTYIVPANNQMALIAKIEDALSGDSGQQALSILFRREGPPYSRLAAAFGAALRHAGARVTDAEIYLSIQSDLVTKSKSDKTVAIQNCIISLLSIISPPAVESINGKATAVEKKD